MGRTVGLLVLLGALVIPLGGCALLAPTPSGSAGATTTPVPTVPTVPPIVSPTLGPDDIPFQIGCSAVVSDDVIYEWGSGNWGADPNYDVAPGSSAEEIVKHGGTACGWINLTSGEKLSVAIGRFAPEPLAALQKERASTAEPVSDFGTDGYFVVKQGTGQADAFRDDYWISASSTWFLSPGDALAIVQAALDAG